MSFPYVLDMHTHTIASGHAYNSLREMAKTAASKGLQALGITEHAPKMPGTCHEFYFQNLKVVPREMYGIRLFLGSEVNILDGEGHVDLSDEEMKNLDVIIASLHLPCIHPGTKEENTRAYLNVMKNPYVDIIGHPDDGRYPVDYRALAEGAKKAHKVLEVNNSSLSPTSFRKGAKENYQELLGYCREYQVPILMGSDAHFDMRVGEFGYAIRLLQELDYPQELVLNRSIQALMEYLHKK